MSTIIKQEIIINKSQMVKILNNHFALLAETSSDKGSLEYYAEEKFIVFEDFTKGNKLSMKWKHIMECHKLYNTNTEPEWLANVEAKVPNFLVLVTKRILGL